MSMRAVVWLCTVQFCINFILAMGILMVYAPIGAILLALFVILASSMATIYMKIEEAKNN